MSISARNETNLPLKIKDNYSLDPNLSMGYYGSLEYHISVGGKNTITSKVFSEKLMQQLKPQEIHVNSGEQALLVLHHEDFQSKKGKEVFLETGDNGLLVARFVKRGEMTVAQWIW